MIIPVSGGKLFAVIAVTYPAGSTCTCTNGTKTYTAKDTSGQWIFCIPSAGTWTVTATDGTNTKTQEVSITAEQQAEKVTLGYWNGELYDAGNQYTDITGGWIRHGTGGTVTFNDDNIYLATLDDYTEGAVNTTNAIDLTGFATLKVTASVTNRQYMLGKVSVYTKNAAGKETVAASAELDSSSTETVTSLDVSGLSGAYYVRIQSSGYSSSYYITGKIHVTKVELEAAA